jgi:antitoxin YefM
MQSVQFEQAKQNLDVLCERAYENHEPYIINRANNHHVVVLSLDDFNAWQETQYLLSTPANAQRLLRSLASARNGKLTAYELIEE